MLQQEEHGKYLFPGFRHPQHLPLRRCPEAQAIACIHHDLEFHAGMHHLTIEGDAADESTPAAGSDALSLYYCLGFARLVVWLLQDACVGGRRSRILQVAARGNPRCMPRPEVHTTFSERVCSMLLITLMRLDLVAGAKEDRRSRTKEKTKPQQRRLHLVPKSIEQKVDYRDSLLISCHASCLVPVWVVQRFHLNIEANFAILLLLIWQMVSQVQTDKADA